MEEGAPAREWGHPFQGGKGKERNFPQNLWRKCSTVYTLILAPIRFNLGF